MLRDYLLPAPAFFFKSRKKKESPIKKKRRHIYTKKNNDLIISYSIVLQKLMPSKFKFLRLKLTILTISVGGKSKIQNFKNHSCAIFRGELSWNFIIFAKIRKFLWRFIRLLSSQNCKLEFLFLFMHSNIFRSISTSHCTGYTLFWIYFLSDLVTTSLFLRQSTV